MKVAVLLLLVHAAAGAFAPVPAPRHLPSLKLTAKKQKKRPNKGKTGSPPAGFGKGFGQTTTAEPSPASAAAEVEDATATSPIHAPLLAWLRSHPNTFISPSFAIRPSPLGGYGGFATAPLRQNELIMQIPRDCCVTFDDALSDPDCGSHFRRMKDEKPNSWGMILIAGWIAKERLLMDELTEQGRRRKHGAYLDSVPWEQGELGQEHVLFWSDDEVEDLLKGSLAYDDALLIRRTVKRAISQLGEFVLPTIRRARGTGDQSTTSIDGEDDADLSNELERAVKGAFVLALSRSFAEEVELDDGSIEVENALLPLIDVLQHSNTPNTMLESYDECVVLRAAREVNEGEELFHQYQEEDDAVIPPHKFFTRYGFVPGRREPVVDLLRERSPLFFAE